MADRTESIILDFEVDLEDSIVNIGKLEKANKALREERKKVNLESVEGQKRVREINATLDQNTNKIKNNVSALEQQKANIGNYKSALDGVHPALGKVATGLESGTKGLKAMTLQALKFLATPLGAALAAIVVVFSLLKSALSQNDALMDKFENVTNAVGVVLEIVVARVGKLGEALIALASGNFSEAIDLTAEAFSGLATEIEGAVKQQQIFLDESRNIADAERNLRIEIAKSASIITSLIKESKNRNLSLDEQSAKLIEASKLEANLQRSREDLALRNLRITARQLRSAKEFQQSTNETFEQYVDRLLASGKLGDTELNKLTDSIVALEEARNSGLVLQQKIENDLTAIQLKRAEALEKQNKALAEQKAIEDANRRAANQVDVKTDDPLQGAFDTLLNKEQELEITERFNDRIVKAEKGANDKILKDKERAAELEKEIENAKLAFTANVLGSIGSLFEQESQEGKILASAQALINTYLAATAALASGSKINPIFGILSSAAAVVAGLASVAKINGVQFAEGGFTGSGGKHVPAGVVHKGEVVWNQEDVRLAGGPMAANALRPTARRLTPYWDGGLVSNSITGPINQQMELLNIVKNLPPQVLDVRESMKIQKRIQVKERISKR